MSLKHAYYRGYQKTMKFAVNFLDWTPPKLIKGAGSVKELPKLVKSEGVNNVLVVTDKGLMGLHLLDGMFEGLDKSNVKYAVYDGTQPNPTIQNIEDARQLYVDNGCDGVIAFGGGSPMDCAKIAAARGVPNPAEKTALIPHITITWVSSSSILNHLPN